MKRNYLLGSICSNTIGNVMKFKEVNAKCFC